MKYCLPIFLLFLSVNAYGALNKWVDADGKVHYSDEPPPANVKAQTLIAPSAASGVSAQKSVAEREAERKKALKTKDEAAQKATQEQEKELAKRRNCEGVKGNLRTLESNAPIATYNDKGERNIIDDSVRQQNIEDARKQINEYCN